MAEAPVIHEFQIRESDPWYGDFVTTEGETWFVYAHEFKAYQAWAEAETARLRAENERLSETYTDEEGTVWSPPTAWAYFAACRALHAKTVALAEAEARGRRQGLEWQPIETAPADYTEMIGMDASGVIARTWFFAPSSQTRKWLKVGLPGKKDWHPVLWMHIPLATAPAETQKPEEPA